MAGAGGESEEIKWEDWAVILTPQLTRGKLGPNDVMTTAFISQSLVVVLS